MGIGEIAVTPYPLGTGKPAMLFRRSIGIIAALMSAAAAFDDG